MDADADFHLVLRQREGRFANMRHGARGERHAHAAGLRVHLLAEIADFRERLAGLGRRAADFLGQDGRADSAPAGRPRAVLHRDVVVDDHALDLQPLGPRHLGGELEVHHVPGIVLHDVKRALAAIDFLRRRQHLVGRGTGEDRARASRIEHPLADEAAVHRFMPAAAARDDGNLVLHRCIGPVNEAGRVFDFDQVGVRGGHAVQRLRDDIFRGVDELFHRFSLLL